MYNVHYLNQQILHFTLFSLYSLFSLRQLCLQVQMCMFEHIHTCTCSTNVICACTCTCTMYMYEHYFAAYMCMYRQTCIYTYMYMLHMDEQTNTLLIHVYTCTSMCWHSCAELVGSPSHLISFFSLEMMFMAISTFRAS